MTYEIDPKPNSDEQFCDNCGMIVDKTDILETIDGDWGCSACISNCCWCGRAHFSQDMFSWTFYDMICDDCIKEGDYKKAVRDNVLKDALRCYFDTIDHGRIEKTIIEVVEIMGYNKLAQEMKSDLK